MILLAICGFCLITAAALLAGRAEAPSAETGLAYAVLAASGIAGAILAWNARGRAALAVVLVPAIIARVFLFASAPIFSHDAYRYLWDARVMLAGFSPSLLAPRHPALAHLAAAPLYALIDYRNIPSLYPPFAYALFYVGALLGNGVQGEKLVMLGGDLLTAMFVLVALRLRGLPAGRAVAYVWSPLVLLEFAQNAHLESWANAAVVASICALWVQQRANAALALSVAILIKLTPAAFVPIAFARAPRWALLTLGTCAAAYGAAYLAGLPVSQSLGNYVAEQRFYPTVFRIIGPAGAAAAFIVFIAAMTWLTRSGASLAGGVIAVQIAFLLCTPNALPWYATLIPAIAPLTNGSTRAWTSVIAIVTAATAALPLAYGAPVFPAGLFVWVMAAFGIATTTALAVAIFSTPPNRQSLSMSPAKETA